jgi:hypothetical protein
MKFLPKTDATRQRHLIELGREINDREEALQLLRSKTIESSNAWLCEVVLQGDALNKAKASLPHGMWIDWLRIHCPLISTRQANSYMLVARNFQRGTAVTEATSLRAALALCDEAKTEKAKESKSWPAYLEALSRIAKFNRLLVREKLESWPAEGIAKLRAELTPMCRYLWPDRFSDDPS